MAENNFKIQLKLNELNNINSGWVAIAGYVALTNLFFQKSLFPRADGNSSMPVFNPHGGVPIKAFMNTNTGEIKLFAANIFED